MKIKFTVSLLIVAVVASCLKIPKTYSRSYILGFYTMDKVHTLVKTPENAIVLYSRMPNLAVIGEASSTDTFRKKRYDELCEKYNDMTYNRMERISPHDGSIRMYLSFGFNSISVTSDAPYDDEHPENTPLDDIAVYMNISVKKYIDSGYASTYDWENPVGVSDFFLEAMVNLSPQMHPIEKRLSELESSELVLLGYGGFGSQIGIIYFPEPPSLSKTHNMTVVLTTDDGQTFSETVTMTFE